MSSCRGRQLDPRQPRPSAYTEGLWGFLLTELPGGRTRLVISGYQTLRPGWLEGFANYWLYVPVVWPMQARMLAVLKRNIEHHDLPRCGHERPAGLCDQPDDVQDGCFRGTRPPGS